MLVELAKTLFQTSIFYWPLGKPSKR